MTLSSLLGVSGLDPFLWDLRELGRDDLADVGRDDSSRIKLFV